MSDFKLTKEGNVWELTGRLINETIELPYNTMIKVVGDIHIENLTIQVHDMLWCSRTKFYGHFGFPQGRPHCYIDFTNGKGTVDGLKIDILDCECQLVKYN